MTWISVKDRQPEIDMVVLVANMRYGMEVFKAVYYRRDNVFVLSNPNIRETIALDITHWMEIPALPKEKE